MRRQETDRAHGMRTAQHDGHRQTLSCSVGVSHGLRPWGRAPRPHSAFCREQSPCSWSSPPPQAQQSGESDLRTLGSYDGQRNSEEGHPSLVKRPEGAFLN